MELYKKSLVSLFLAIILVMPQVIHAVTEKPEIPQWVKNTAKWWADGKTTDNKFLISLAFLAKAKIITMPDSGPSSNSNHVPGWLRSVALWYAENEISEEEYENTIQYLVQINSIEISRNLFNIIDQRGLAEIEYTGRSSLFRMFAYAQDFRIINGKPTPLEAHFALLPQLYRNGTYDQISIWDRPNTAVVIVPLFTSTAYWEPGFYTYYRGDCSSSCLTKKITFDRPGGFSASQNGANVLSLLGYDTLTDLDVDNNPQILERYNKVIVLHNEYVTQKEFDAITHHPKVIYLYANPLYAEVSVNYQNDTITLLKGHGYPTPNILNGFDWKFDNHEKEYNTDCIHASFHTVGNGIMLDCYPEDVIYSNMTLLKIIKNY